MAPKVDGINCEPVGPFDPLSPEMLPPVRLCKYATPVKAKTSAPPPLPRTTCAALTWRGLVAVTRTGSRGRGSGCGRRWTGRNARGGGSRSAGRMMRGPLGRLRWAGFPPPPAPCRSYLGDDPLTVPITAARSRSGRGGSAARAGHSGTHRSGSVGRSGRSSRE